MKNETQFRNTSAITRFPSADIGLKQLSNTSIESYLGQNEDQIKAFLNAEKRIGVFGL